MSSSGRRRAAAPGFWLGVLLLTTACTGGSSGTGEGAGTTVAPGSVASSVPQIEPSTPPTPDTVTDALGDDEAVLTGIPTNDVGVLQRPALAVKIDNIDSARPQSGIGQADVVFEELVEGGLTRLLAVFHSTDPDIIGPVRSARSTDVPLLMPLAQPLFSWSGSNAAFAELLDVTALIDVGVDSRPEAYVRRDDRAPPSNLYTSAATLRSYTPADSLRPRAMFEFLPIGQQRAAGARAVEGVSIDWGTTQVEFRWDAEVGGWVRSQNGSIHVDADGVAVAPENVIIQFVPYVDTDAVDANGAPVPEAQIVDGQGSAWVLSGGAVTEGSWFKANLTVTSEFRDDTLDEIEVSRGRTWVLLVPEDQATLLFAG